MKKSFITSGPVSSVHSMWSYGFVVSSCGQWILRSAWACSQADPSLLGILFFVVDLYNKSSTG